MEITPLGSWLVVTIVLFALGVILPGVGAVRAYLGGVGRLRRAEADQLLAAELNRGWTAENEALQERFTSGEISTVEFDALNTEISERWHKTFADRGLRAPDLGSLTRRMNGEADVELMRLLIDRNGFNLALILAGPTLAIVASILALFPAWRLPA